MDGLFPLFLWGEKAQEVHVPSDASLIPAMEVTPCPDVELIKEQEYDNLIQGTAEHKSLIPQERKEACFVRWWSHF